MEVDILVGYRKELEDRLAAVLAQELDTFVRSTGVAVESINVTLEYVKYLGNNKVELMRCNVKARLDI